MKTLTFEQLRDAIIKSRQNYTVTVSAMGSAATHISDACNRVLAAFVHGDGVRVLRDACELIGQAYDTAPMRAEWDELAEDSHNKLKALINQLDGEPTK